MSICWSGSGTSGKRKGPRRALRGHRRSVQRGRRLQPPEECPPDRYDAAILAVPNAVKLRLLEYFLPGQARARREAPGPRARCRRAAGRGSGRGGAIWYTSYNFRFEPNVVALKRHLEAGGSASCTGSACSTAMGPPRTSSGPGGTAVRRPRGHGLPPDRSYRLRLRPVGASSACRAAATSSRAPTTASSPPRIARYIECSFLSWKNRWRIEAVGEQGALEMDGLTKWGRSELVWWPPATERGARGAPRDRAWPRSHLGGGHPPLRGGGRGRATSCENDLWLSRTVQAAATPVATTP